MNNKSRYYVAKKKKSVEMRKHRYLKKEGSFAGRRQNIEYKGDLQFSVGQFEDSS